MRRPGEGEDRRSATTKPRARRSEQKGLHAQRPQEAELRRLARTEERRLMPRSETMNLFTCSSACEAASEPDPAIRANDCTAAAAPAGPTEAVESADEDTPWRRAHPAPVDDVLGGAALDPPGRAYRARIAWLAGSCSGPAPLPHRAVFAFRETSPLPVKAEPSPFGLEAARRYLLPEEAGDVRPL